MKSITSAVFLLISSSAAFAQQPVLTAGPAAPDPLTIKVTRERLQQIGQGVMKLPYETAAPILLDLQAQLNALDEAARKAAEPKPEPTKEPEKAKK
jgi:hypothetical protein